MREYEKERSGERSRTQESHESTEIVEVAHPREVLRGAERSLWQHAHDTIASYRRGDKEVPRWARAALIGAKLFTAETAAADTLSDSPVREIVAPYEKPKAAYEQTDKEIAKSVREVMERYLAPDGPTQGHIEVHVQTHDGKEAYAKTYALSAEDFAHGAIALEGRVSGYTLSRSGDVATFGLSDGYESTFVYEKNGNHHFSGQYHDFYGNVVCVSREYHDGEATFDERVSVGRTFNQMVGEMEFRALNIDLGPVLGLAAADIRGAMLVESLRPLAEIGGVPVYAETALQTEVFEDNRADITQGIQDTLRLFGQDTLTVKRIVIADTHEANATATEGQIRFFHGLLTDSARSEMQYAKRSIRSVASHETLHTLDFSLGISQNPEIHKLFDTTDANALAEFDEEAFGDLFGGHAWENAEEMTASVFNTLDEPSWNAKMQNLSPEARAFYLAYLTTARTFLEAHEDVPDDAPILVLLKRRSAQLESYAK